MKRRDRISFYMFLCILLIVLFSGLNPREYDFSNHVSWNIDGPGIQFDKYGIAYVQLGHKPLERINGRNGFSLLMVFKPERLDNNGSGHIVTVHDGNDRNQLVIWQWFSHIIAMNDTDYTHRRKVGRVSAPVPAPSAQEMYLSLTTGPKGSVLYFDGKAVSTNRSLVLEFPKGMPTTLALGNSVYGNGPWQGTVSGLALFDRELEPESIVSLYNAWIGEGKFSAAAKEGPVALYLFDEKEGDQVADRAGNAGSLLIPARATPLRRRYLAGSMGDSGLKGGFLRDAVINLAGFIPFGFFLAAALIHSCGTAQRRSVVYTVVLGFAVSLTIEIIQAWIPGRSSQLPDLLLNTAGALVGALLSIKGYRKLQFLISG